MAINIKDFVSLRCKITVENDNEEDGYKPLIIELGQAQIKHAFSADQIDQLKGVLAAIGCLKPGLLLMEDQKKELAEKIKDIIIDMIDDSEKFPKIKYSHFISKKLNYSYNYLTTVFAEIKGITIENFIILHKIEKVKELIVFSNLTLTEIASQMQYSNISHLSNQFKKITGVTPTEYKKIKKSKQPPAAA